MTATRITQRALSLMLSAALVLSSGCGGSGRSGNSAYLRTDDNVVRYKLPLRDNPVDKHEASLCYGACQRETSPGDYLSCLSECPGFEVAVGETCGKNDLPPVAACVVVRKMKQTTEPDKTGMVVLGVVGAFVLVVTAASLCASSSSSTQCSYSEVAPPR
jgi:hypothetical protein